jgi:hypothetical protein
LFRIFRRAGKTVIAGANRRIVVGKRPCATGADNGFVADGKTAPAVVQGRRFLPAERQVKAVKDFFGIPRHHFLPAVFKPAEPSFNARLC